MLWLAVALLTLWNVWNHVTVSDMRERLRQNNRDLGVLTLEHDNEIQRRRTARELLAAQAAKKPLTDTKPRRKPPVRR